MLYNDCEWPYSFLTNKKTDTNQTIQKKKKKKKFEIKDGGSSMADGTAKSPEINPNGLLHEEVANRIKAKNL